MNSYEAKQAARKERYEERAANARAESSSTYDRAKSMASAIPFGQPVHAGHHSEKRDRSFRERIHKTYGKAFALEDKAQHYEQKAASVGTGGISSDDPDALKKLRAELASVEADQVFMKTVNKVIRQYKTTEDRTAALVAQGLTTEQAAEVLTPGPMRAIGFPSYRLSNNSANARRIAGRIAQLEKMQKREDAEQQCDGYTYREDVAENRVMFIFEGKPAEQIRTLLKSHAFKWSPSRGAWVRQLTNSGLWSARKVKEGLTAMKQSAES